MKKRKTKQKMKKLILLLTLFALVASSCASDDDGSSQDQFIGTWKYSQAFEDGVEYPLEDCEDETTISISLNSTFTSSIYEDLGNGCELEYTGSGTWVNSGSGMYSITAEGDTFVQQVEFSGNTMIFEDTDDGVVYRDIYIRQ